MASFSRRRVFCLCAIVASAAFSVGWTGEDEQFYYISGDGYQAICSKVTGLCQFVDPNNALLLSDTADTYLGFWQGRPFNLVESTDEAWLTANQYPVSSMSLAETGDDAVLSVARECPQAQFLNTYAFNRLNGRVKATGRITYQQQVNITNEALRLGMPGTLRTGYSDSFEVPTFVNPTQVDSMDASNGWVPYANSTVVGDSAIVREGTGSVHLTVNDDNDGVYDYPGMQRSFSPPRSAPNGRVMSFWVYPDTRVRFQVSITGEGISVNTSSTWFEANCWSRFQWDFGNQGLTAQSLSSIKINVVDNGYYFSGPQANLYIDDIRISQSVEGGLSTLYYWRDDWFASLSGNVSIDEAMHLQGNASLKWSDIDLTTSARVLQIYTTAQNSTANPRLPSDLTPYQYVSLAVYSEVPINMDVRIAGATPATPARLQTFNIPANAWTPVCLDFRNNYTTSGGYLDLTHVCSYQILLDPDGRASARIWIDNFSLRGPTTAQIFDSQKADYDASGRGVRYSARRFRLPGGALIHGDSMGAAGIEAMEIDPYNEAVNCFMRRVDFHNMQTTVDRNGNDTSPAETHYKEQTRMPGEQVSGSVVLDFSPSANLEVVKSRYPRAFKMGYSIGDDDLYVDACAAFYCGTNDVTSPEYGKHGVLGNNLMISKNAWYWLPGKDIYSYHTDPVLVNLLDLMYSRGTEIAFHTPGSKPNDRSQCIPALDDLVGRYGVHQLVDHSASVNPEDTGRTGCYSTVNGLPNDTLSGYYVLDLLKEHNFDLILVGWAFNHPDGSPNLYANPSPGTFKAGFPLPSSNQLLGTNASGNTIWGYARGYGNRRDEFFTPAGGGDINTLQQLIGSEALVITPTHDHAGFTHIDSDGFTVLDSEVENVFAWLQQQQDAGTIWVDTVSNLLFWLIDSENVVISDQQGNVVTVENRNPNPLDGVTLRVLNNQSIRSATIGDRYQVYVDGSRIVLPTFAANEIKAVTINTGEYDSNLPRLVHVDAHVTVSSAEYDPDAITTRIVLANSTSHDVANKSISFANMLGGDVALKDNGMQFAYIHNGRLRNTSPTPQHSVKMDASTLTVTWFNLGQQTLTIEPFVGPQEVIADFNDDGYIDTIDLDIFAGCRTGPDQAYDAMALPPGCSMTPLNGLIDADLDGDGDVDQVDFGLFQRCLSDENTPADPNCAN